MSIQTTAYQNVTQKDIIIDNFVVDINILGMIEFIFNSINL